ncbi:MAG: hypothetical protein ABJE95_30815 [Byssovorax sp.]
MLVRRGLAVLSFAGVASWSGLAGAQYFHADPTVRLTGGYLFNRVIPDDPGLNPVDQSGPLITFAPSLALTYDTPRVTQKLTLSGTLGLPLASNFTFSGQPPTYNLRLLYTGNVPIDALTKLTLTGSTSAAPINGFATNQDPSLTPIEAPPADFSYNFTINGTETLHREISEPLSVTQTTNVNYAFPFNVQPIRASTLTVKNSLAATRQWTLDTLTLTGSVGVTRFGPAETGAGVTEPRVQITNDLTLLWKRPFTQSLNGSVHVGVSQTLSPGSIYPPVYAPTGGGQLTYIFEPVSITLLYNYAAAVDIYTATTNLNNTASVRAVVPVTTTGLVISGSGGYANTVPIGGVGVGLNSVTSDVGLTYAPTAVPKLNFTLRGNYAHQVPVDNPLAGTSRFGLTFNVGYSYPNAVAVDAVGRLVPAFNPTANLDGGDVALGQEIPALEPAAPIDVSDVPPAAPAPAPAATP